MLPQVLDLEKGIFEGIGIDDVVLDARKPSVRLVHVQFGDARRPAGLFELQLPVEKRHDDVIIFMTMPARFGAGRESELSDPHMRLVDLDGCNSLWASGHDCFLSVGGIVGVGIRRILPRAHTLVWGAYEFLVGNTRDIDMNRGFVLMGGVGLLFSAQLLGQDAMQYGVKHLKVLAEDDKVRVLEYSPKKGDRTPMHSHPSSVVYVLKGGRVKYTLPDGSTKISELKTGETLLRPPVTHSDEALDDVDSILIELKK
jgi:beta-alanine degradation protein BauB